MENVTDDALRLPRSNPSPRYLFEGVCKILRPFPVGLLRTALHSGAVSLDKTSEPVLGAPFSSNRCHVPHTIWPKLFLGTRWQPSWQHLATFGDVRTYPGTYVHR